MGDMLIPYNFPKAPPPTTMEDDLAIFKQREAIIDGYPIMLHYLSKLTTLFWQPLTWVAVLLVMGVLFLFVRSPKLRLWGRTLCASAAGLLLLLGWQPLPEALVQILEDRYAAPSGDLSRFTGMVVLGGAFRGNDGRNRAQPALGCAGERVVLPVPIMNQYPHMRLLFTGGNASLFSQATYTDRPSRRCRRRRSSADTAGRPHRPSSP